MKNYTMRIKLILIFNKKNNIITTYLVHLEQVWEESKANQKKMNPQKFIDEIVCLK
jgi:hypothetical protein